MSMFEQIFGPFDPFDAVVLAVCLGTATVCWLIDCRKSEATKDGEVTGNGIG